MMKHLLLFLMLYVLSACAEPIDRPTIPEIPPELLTQAHKPTLQGNSAGEVALLVVGLSGALDKANSQLAAIACLYARWLSAVDDTRVGLCDDTSTTQ